MRKYHVTSGAQPQFLDSRLVVISRAVSNIYKQKFRKHRDALPDSQVVGIDAMPPEILHRIFIFIADDAQFEAEFIFSGIVHCCMLTYDSSSVESLPRPTHTGSGTLSRLVLVCKSWYHWAIQLLYHRPVLTFRDRRRIFRDTVVRNSKLAVLVKDLYLEEPYPITKTLVGRIRWTPNATHYNSDIPDILSVCTKVQYVTFSSQVFHVSLLGEFLRRNSSITNRLSSLVIHGWAFQTSFYSFSFDNLRCLRLYNPSRYSTYHNNNTTGNESLKLPLMPKLDTLQLCEVKVWPNIPLGISHFASSLRILDLYDNHFKEGFTTLPCLPHLEHLTLVNLSQKSILNSNLSSRISSHPSSIFSSPNLRSLVLGVFPTRVSDQDSTPQLLSDFRFPSQLESITFLIRMERTDLLPLKNKDHSSDIPTLQNILRCLFLNNISQGNDRDKWRNTVECRKRLENFKLDDVLSRLSPNDIFGDYLSTSSESFKEICMFCNNSDVSLTCLQYDLDHWTRSFLNTSLKPSFVYSSTSLYPKC
ncbi:hypothetical protein ABKN59_011485 [Abortiporus biennis]